MEAASPSVISAAVPRVRAVAVAAALLLAFGVRVALAWLHVTPDFFPDEYLYESLARGLAHGHVFEIRGHDATLSQTASYLVPAIMAPVWLVHDVDVSYRLTQLLGSLVLPSVLVVAACVVPGFVDPL